MGRLARPVSKTAHEHRITALLHDRLHDVMVAQREHDRAGDPNSGLRQTGRTTGIITVADMGEIFTWRPEQDAPFRKSTGEPGRSSPAFRLGPISASASGEFA